MEGTTGEARSQEVTNIIKGLMEVQPKLHVERNKTGQVGNQRYKYADLASVWDSCRELLKDQGMVIMHSSSPNTTNDAITVTATLWHTSGQWMSSSITMKPRSMTPQEVGSALTYGRRYTLASLVGIVVDDDDDGKKASSTPPAKLKELKAKLRSTLDMYQGEDKELLRQECTAAQKEGKFDEAFALSIFKRLNIEP